MANTWKVRSWKVKGGRKHGSIAFKEKVGAVTTSWSTGTIVHSAEGVRLITLACQLLNSRKIELGDQDGFNQAINDATEEYKRKKLKSFERKVNKEFKDNPEIIEQLLSDNK